MAFIALRALHLVCMAQQLARSLLMEMGFKFGGRRRNETARAKERAFKFKAQLTNWTIAECAN